MLLGDLIFIWFYYLFFAKGNHAYALKIHNTEVLILQTNISFSYYSYPGWPQRANDSHSWFPTLISFLCKSIERVFYYFQPRMNLGLLLSNQTKFQKQSSTWPQGSSLFFNFLITIITFFMRSYKDYWRLQETVLSDGVKRDDANSSYQGLSPDNDKNS